MFVFRKIWRALFSCNTRFEIQTFALLPTKSKSSKYQTTKNLTQWKFFMQIWIMKQQLLQDAAVFLLLIYTLGQLECFPPHHHAIWRYILISSVTLIWFTTIWKVKYLIFFPNYILSPVVTTCHTNLMLRRSTFSKGL